MASTPLVGLLIRDELELWVFLKALQGGGGTFPSRVTMSPDVKALGRKN